MKCRTLVILFLVSLLSAIPAAAGVSWYLDTSDGVKTYHYTYTNTEEAGDTIMGFHVYAPVDVSLVSGGTSDEGWEFATAPDPSGALDIYWESVDSDTYGVDPGDSVQVSLVTALSVATDYNYVIPDVPIGNWGYDGVYAGGTWTMFGSVPVPKGAVMGAPEPASIICLAAGCLCLVRIRRKIS